MKRLRCNVPSGRNGINGPATLFPPHTRARNPRAWPISGLKEMARLSPSIRTLGAACALTTIAAAPLHGQGFDLRKLFGLPAVATGTTTPPVAAPAAASEWSGESGKSGHPLMAADAIRAAAA